MLIADVMYQLRRTLEGEACEVQELTDYFAPILQANLPDTASRYFAATASFLLLQLSMWECATLAVGDARLSELIVSYGHKLLGSEARPLPETIRVMKLPTAEGWPRLELQAVEPSMTFAAEHSPNGLIFAIVSGGDLAHNVLEAWTAGSRASSLALLIKAPLGEFDPLVAALAEVEHRVAGWLSVHETDGQANAVALFVLGADRDEI